jgi:hypothetical protein
MCELHAIAIESGLQLALIRRRSTVQTDDVLVLARRQPALKQQLSNFADTLSANKKEKRKRAPVSKKKQATIDSS